MCGIVAVLGRRPTRALPGLDELEELLRAIEARRRLIEGPDSAGLRALTDEVRRLDQLLVGRRGVEALLAYPALRPAIETVGASVGTTIEAAEADLDRAAELPTHLEDVNAALTALRDAIWSLTVDRLRTLDEVVGLAGDGPGPSALDAYLAIAMALSGLDRLEVRGRDSAGLHVLVAEGGLDLADPELAAELASRQGDRLFRSMSIRSAGDGVGFVYKVAAEIGELGDNVAALREAIAGDRLLARAVRGPEARVAVLAHTRWASVGIISDANAHPLDQEELDQGLDPARYAVAALNGDVDNHERLRSAMDLAIDPLITTDAKIIPAVLARNLARGTAPRDAFSETVRELEGSVAVAAQLGADPDSLLLAQRGSGQGLYVGLAEDCFVVASEPYGLVREASEYLRLDGDNGGEVVVLSRAGAGTLAGVERFGYDGRQLRIQPAEVLTAQVTTRDIDRRGYRHYLLKEISESPDSMRKTIRGRVLASDEGLVADLGDEALGPELRTRLGNGEIRRILVIGQGTAAVAGQAVAAALRSALGSAPMTVEAMPATELSGFGLARDMDDVLVVAVSQSGNTTDTNRTVEMARARRASVVGIVNRRNSDLTVRADGVIYTSDGRDVEMSVASTKAFYAQVGAGVMLAAAVARALGSRAGVADDATQEMLGALRSLPEAMEKVLARSTEVARAAADAPRRRYWAVVGSGRNRIAASEVRIKLSELCYKSISCDSIEDKKHIDLSSEPLVLVCAAGLSGANAEDVAKEIQIYRAHRALPVVVASEGSRPYEAAVHTIEVPRVGGGLDFVLSTMVGHLFGYHAALAIDAQAQPLREAQALLRQATMASARASGPLGPSGGAGEAVPASEGVLARVGPDLAEAARDFLARLADGLYDGHLEARTASDLASLLRFGAGWLPLEAYEAAEDGPVSPGQLLEELAAALTSGVNQLSRPIDAIKHQAKTVTVGISRSEDDLLRVELVRQVLGVAPILDRLSYRNLRQLVALDPAVVSVDGFTRYRIEGQVGQEATIQVVDQGGVAKTIPSRTASDPTLRGTKRGAVDQRDVTVAVGRSDGRSVILVPETRGQRAVGLVLLHARFHQGLAPEVAADVLRGYRDARYEALVNAVTETEPRFDPEVLGRLTVLELLVAPVLELAERWRSQPPSD